MRDTRLITLTVDQLLKDSYFKGGICRISTNCSGGGAGSITSVNGNPGPVVVLTASDIDTTGGDSIQDVLDNFGTPTLQSVTTGPGNNITNNVVTVTGTNNFDGSQNGLHILNSPGLGGIIYYINGPLFSNVAFSETGGVSLNSPSGVVFTVTDDSSQPSSITGRLSGEPGVDTNDFVTVGQLTSGGIINSVLTGQPPSATLLPNHYYSYIGEDDISYDLPPVAGNTGTRIGVISGTTEIITLNGDMNDAGTNIITTIQILSGQKRILYNNSLAWVFLT